ncbi:MAG: hypothetical protein KJ556_21395 [Gammaproteobacteria bacterium]|nr:hypothetical protein [Gammaproteobacteria bacterium]
MPDINIDVYARLHNAEKQIAELKDQIKGTGKASDESKDKMSGMWKQIAGGVLSVEALKRALRGAQGLAMSFLEVARETETYRIRLKTLLGSQEAAEKAMGFFQQTAATLPFTLQDVIESGTRLAAIKVPFEKWLPRIADLAASFGMDLPTATDQMARAMSAGLGAADLFREKGINAMIEAFAKEKFAIQDISKVSLPELHKVLYEFLKTQEGGAADLASSWDGMMSMLDDAWFQFRQLVMESGVFDFLKEELKGVLDKINELKETGKLKEYAETTAGAIMGLFDALVMIKNALTDLKPATQAGAEALSELTMKAIGLKGPQQEMNDLQAEAIKKAIEFKNSLKHLSPSMEDIRKHFEQGTEKAEAWMNELRESDARIESNKEGYTKLATEVFGYLGILKDTTESEKGNTETKENLAKAISALKVKTKDELNVELKNLVANIEAARASGQVYDEQLRKSAQEAVNLANATGQHLSPEIRRLAGEFKAVYAASKNELEPAFKDLGFAADLIPPIYKRIGDEGTLMGSAVGGALGDIIDKQEELGVETFKVKSNYEIFGKTAITTNDEIKENTKRTVKETKDFWSEMTDGIKTKWISEFSAVLQHSKTWKEGLSSVWGTIKGQFFDMVASMITKWTIGLVGNVLSGGKSILSGITSVFGGIGKAATGAEAGTGAGGLFGGLSGSFLGSVAKIAGPIGIGLLISKFVDFKKVGEAVTGALCTAIETIGGVIKSVGKVFESIFGAGANIISGIGNVVGVLGTAITSLGGLLTAGGKKYGEITYWLELLREINQNALNSIMHISDKIDYMTARSDDINQSTQKAEELLDGRISYRLELIKDWSKASAQSISDLNDDLNSKATEILNALTKKGTIYVDVFRSDVLKDMDAAMRASLEKVAMAEKTREEIDKLKRDLISAEGEERKKLEAKLEYLEAKAQDKRQAMIESMMESTRAIDRMNSGQSEAQRILSDISYGVVQTARAIKGITTAQGGFSEYLTRTKAIVGHAGEYAWIGNPRNMPAVAAHNIEPSRREPAARPSQPLQVNLILNGRKVGYALIPDLEQLSRMGLIKQDAQTIVRIES